jgi:hypothetical protein
MKESKSGMGDKKRAQIYNQMLRAKKFNKK